MDTPLDAFARQLDSFVANTTHIQDWLDDGESFDIDMDSIDLDIREMDVSVGYSRGYRSTVEINSVEFATLKPEDINIVAVADDVVMPARALKELRDAFAALRDALTKRPLADQLREIADQVDVLAGSYNASVAQITDDNNTIIEQRAKNIEYQITTTKLLDALHALDQACTDASDHNYGTLSADYAKNIVQTALGYNAPLEQPTT